MHRASLGVQFIYPVAEVLIDLTQYTNWNVTKVELVPVNTCQQPTAEMLDIPAMPAAPAADSLPGESSATATTTANGASSSATN